MATLKPYKNYTPVVYDYANELPVGWQLLPNIAIFQERIERGHEKEELLSVTIGRGVIKQTEVDIKKDSSNEDKSKYKLIKVGDIAYNRMRMWQGALGYSNYQGITSPAYVILKPKMKINQRFFHYMFRTTFYTNYSKRFSYGIVDDQLSLRYTDFKRMYSILPPIEVQNEIVNYLDTKTQAIEKFIRNKERFIELLEEERRGFIDRTIHQILKTPFEKKPLKYIVRLLSEQTTKRKENESYLALENIESWTGKIDLSIGADEFESNAKRFRTTDVLFNKLRPYLAKVVVPEFNGICVSELLVLRPSKQVLREFLFYKLISRRFIDYIDSSTYGSKMPRASWDVIGKVEIEFPNDLEIQRNIVSKIKEEESRIATLKTKIKKEIIAIKEYREAIVTAVVTGKINVTEKQLQLS
ncbi:MAG: restriction endonuclease subunit S [Bacteroidia bacterium]